MSDNPYSFRTALQGFNRSDVVNFIEATTTKHENELRQLQADNARLQQQLDEANIYIDQLEETIAGLQAAAPKPPASESEPIPVLLKPVSPPVQTPPGNFEELELAAYRRAEQAERAANERANNLLHQLDQLVDQTDRDLESGDHTLSHLAGELSGNIAALQKAILDIRSTIDASVASMKSLRSLPREENPV